MPEVISKPVNLPDPGERTKNDPIYLMSSNDVLKLIKGRFNGKKFFVSQDHMLSGSQIEINQWSEKDHILPETVKELIDEAYQLGWMEVKLIGKQLVFTSAVVGLK